MYSTSNLFPLYVIIPNWSLKQDTIECVTSVLTAAQGLNVVSVVVDNGSTDGSREALVDAFGARVTELVAERNLGFAGAANLGIRYALEHQAGSVLLLNNDTVLDRQMLTTLCQAAEAHPEAGMLAPAIYYASKPTRLWRLGDRQYRWLPMPLRVPDRQCHGPSLQLDYVTGCAMLVRREVIEVVGLLDERFFMYYEDADFCRRVREHNYVILGVPKAQMWHKISMTARRNMAINTYWHARGQILFYRKHPRAGMTILSHMYVLLRTAYALAHHWLRGEWATGHAIWCGTRDGYRLPLTSGGEIGQPGPVRGD